MRAGFGGVWSGGRMSKHLRNGKHQQRLLGESRGAHRLRLAATSSSAFTTSRRNMPTTVCSADSVTPCSTSVRLPNSPSTASTVHPRTMQKPRPCSSKSMSTLYAREVAGWHVRGFPAACSCRISSQYWSTSGSMWAMLLVRMSRCRSAGSALNAAGARSKSDRPLFASRTNSTFCAPSNHSGRKGASLFPERSTAMRGSTSVPGATASRSASAALSFRQNDAQWPWRISVLLLSNTENQQPLHTSMILGGSGTSPLYLASHAAFLHKKPFASLNLSTRPSISFPSKSLPTSWYDPWCTSMCGRPHHQSADWRLKGDPSVHRHVCSLARSLAPTQSASSAWKPRASCMIRASISSCRFRIDARCPPHPLQWFSAPFHPGLPHTPFQHLSVCMSRTPSHPVALSTHSTTTSDVLATCMLKDKAVPAGQVQPYTP
mmetsp:Transcript_35467/g.70971  ORF Transcript_35467/g.70971 Transcript_35467/m.70971 type:complete len:433 (-) Transcript_35467:3013-4311(-)